MENTRPFMRPLCLSLAPSLCGSSCVFHTDSHVSLFVALLSVPVLSLRVRSPPCTHIHPLLPSLLLSTATTYKKILWRDTFDKNWNIICSYSCRFTFFSFFFPSPRVVFEQWRWSIAHSSGGTIEQTMCGNEIGDVPAAAFAESTLKHDHIYSANHMCLLPTPESPVSYDLQIKSPDQTICFLPCAIEIALPKSRINASRAATAKKISKILKEAAAASDHRSHKSVWSIPLSLSYWKSCIWYISVGATEYFHQCLLNYYVWYYEWYYYGSLDTMNDTFERIII